MIAARALATTSRGSLPRSGRWPDRARALVVALIAFFVIHGDGACAGETPAPRAELTVSSAVGPKAVNPANRRPAATLTLFNRPIVSFRAQMFGVPPSERAAAAHNRIVSLLEQGGDADVTVEKVDGGNIVKVGGKLAFGIGEDDVEPLSGETLATVTASTVAALQRAIAETREVRDGRLMVAAAIWAGGATLVYILALVILRFASHAASRRMRRLADAAADKVRIGGTEILNRRSVIGFVRLMVRIVFWLAALLLTYQWIGLVLGRFPFTRAWGEQLNAFLVGTALDMLNTIAQAMPELLVVAVIIVIARAVTGLLRSFFDRIQERRISVSWLDADSARPTRRLVTVAIWVFALAMAYPYIPGSGTEAFKGVSVLLGLMVSIGASGIVGQAASGLILMYTRTFRPGEFVRIGEHEGTVVEMGMFTTRIRTGLGEELTVPNSHALSVVSKNYSRTVQGVGFVLDTTVTIGYDAPWRQVEAMLVDAARRTPGVLSSPAPHVFQTALSDFYVEYRLVCQAIPGGPQPRAEVLSALHANVQDVFNENGVQIMSPHYLGDPAEAKIVPRSRWHETPASPQR